MDFKKIDFDSWDRKEYFEHYFAHIPCTYSMTVKLDITTILDAKQKIYPVMLYLLGTIVNRHKEFRTTKNAKGDLIIFNRMYPCYTVFHKDTELFSNIWTKYFENYTDFYAAYQLDLQQYGEIHKMIAKPNIPENTFPVSMVPWESFESFHLNLQRGYDYLLPIFTMGKYYKEGNRFFLPLAIQVHHGVCDGFHVCRAVKELRELIALW